MAASIRHRSRPVLSGPGAVRIVPDYPRLDNGRTMGHRLSKIYTRTGDRGETGLGDGSRTAKTSLRVEAMGEVDEVNSFLCVMPLMVMGSRLE